jgi:hypothetical protein
LIAAAPAFTIVPSVIVYPLEAGSSDLNREDSARIATTLATQIAIGGAVKVIPPKAGVERANYLADARQAGANYYVTGFITPLGSGASVVEQVVSTVSGTIVFNITNYITSLDDIIAQGDALRNGIIERGNRALQAFQAPPPAAATPAPEPSNGAETSINKMFAHKKGEAPASVALVPPMDATIGILTVGGSAGYDQRTAAAKSIAAAIERGGRHAVIVNADTPSNDVCAANKTTSLVAAWLDTPANANAALRMIAYDCSGKIAYDHSFHEPLAGVTDDAVSAYLSPAKGRG